MVRFVISLLFFAQIALSATQAEVEKMYLKVDQSPVITQTLSKDMRAKLFKLARFHKVASLEAVEKYDPTGEIGFCFGRAMTVNLIARKMGLDSNSIRKLFVIGDLRQGENPEWRFHVTTLVKGDDSKWYAIDPIMQWPLAPGGPILMENWMEIVQKTWDKDKRAQFYLTGAATVLPDLREVPDPDKEEGKHVIELKFEPKKHQGFESSKIGGFEFSNLSAKAQDDFFTGAYEAKEDDRFSYLGMRINGKMYDFRHYFEDLLEDLSKSESTLP